jgi:hypothetical protein
MSGMVASRKSWGRVSPSQAISLPRTNSTRNLKTPYAATYQTKLSPGGSLRRRSHHHSTANATAWKAIS